MISVLLSKKWRCQCCLVMFPKEGLPALRRAGNALPPDLKLSHLHTCQQGVSVTVSLAQRKNHQVLSRIQTQRQGPCSTTPVLGWTPRRESCAGGISPSC